MLFGLLVTLFICVCVLLVLVILVQQSKGGLGGLGGGLGGSAQMLFGGSGGTDVFQKITWILGAIFMIGSLLLALMKAPNADSRQLAQRLPAQHAPVHPVNQPEPLD
jgi:preprotein translocase subunit SecG